MTMTDFYKIDEYLASEPDPAFARRAKIIIENLEISGSEKVLDVGCGRGFYLKILKGAFPKLRLFGIEINEKYLDIAGRSLAGKSVVLTLADAIDLPFKNNSFDRIIASEIIEHIKGDEKAVSEIYRTLKPGGVVIASVPNKDYPLLWDPLNWFLERFFKIHLPPRIWWLAGIWADHQKLYSEKELEKLFQKVGFEIGKTWKTTHYCLPFSHFVLYGLGKNLVELGFLKDFNRFRKINKPSYMNKILLWPVRFIDRLNETRKGYKTSVNIIMKARKPR